MWGVSLTWPMLFYIECFSYTPHAVLCAEFFLHTPYCFMWGVSLTHHVLFYMGSFSYTPHDVLPWEFLLHTPCFFTWGVSLTRPMLFYVWSFLTFVARRETDQCKKKVSRVKSAYRASDQASVVITWLLCLGSGRMLSMWGIAVIGFSVGISPWQTQLVWICPRYRHPADRGSEPTWPMFLHHQSMIFVWHCGSFSYTPCSVLCGKFLLHSLFCFMWEVSLTLLILFYVGSFSYTPRAVLCGEFLLHSRCCFLWEFVLHAPCYFGHVGNFS